MHLNEVLPIIKDYLKTSKDLSQLLNGNGSLINCFNETTHRLHGKVDSLGANTGRMTHNSPNITQVPKDKEFRELLCVPKDKLLVDVDADQLELVMMGHYLSKYDNYKYAITVDSGDKEKGTDIHTVNQKAAGLATRDAAKTFIYMTCYGAGEAKIGHAVWDKKEFKYTKQEYDQAKEKALKRVIAINGKDYFPLDKNSLTPFDENIILASIYGKQIVTRFLDNTLGYRQLVADTIASVKHERIIGLDGRYLNVRANHKAFNLLLQSAGAIFMKYYLITIDKELNKYFKHGKEYGYVANIHDAVNLEIIPEIKPIVEEILTKGFKQASDMLGLKYQVKGKPSFGHNQGEVH